MAHHEVIDGPPGEQRQEVTIPLGRTRAIGIVRLVRPKQWIKNVFVFAPLVFAGLYMEGDAVARAALAALLFSVGASTAYVLNDLIDVERDRQHLQKRYTRPLAAGTVRRRDAVGLLAVLYALLLGSFWFWPTVLAVIWGYVLLNVVYSLKLKHVPVVDIFCIATGFVLRIWAGALAIDVPLSSWMLITMLCLSLYLAAVKRRQELATRGNTARSVLGAYSVALLDRYAEMAAVATVLFYSLYVVEVRPELVISVPVVIFGMFRYWYLVEALDAGESPTDTLYEDLPLILSIVAWAGLAVFAMSQA